jgi:GxxExxY protein
MERQDAKPAKSAKSEPDLGLDQLAHRVIGAALAVHRALGPGFLESTYELALCIELAARAIPFRRQVPFLLHYRGEAVGGGRVDMLVGERLILELKAVDALEKFHSAQLLAYLRATGLPLGLLINFNVMLLRDGLKRVIQSG